MKRMTSTQSLIRTLFTGLAAAAVLFVADIGTAYSFGGKICPSKRPYRPNCSKVSCMFCGCSKKGTLTIKKKARLQVVGSLQKSMKRACKIAEQLGHIECRKRGFVKSRKAKKIRQYRRGSSVWCEIQTTCNWRYKKKCDVMEARVRASKSKIVQKTLSGTSRKTDKRKACYGARLKVINECRKLKGKLFRRKCRGSNITHLTCEAYNPRSGLCIHVGHCRYTNTKTKLVKRKVCWCTKPRLKPHELVLLRKHP